MARRVRKAVGRLALAAVLVCPGCASGSREHARSSVDTSPPGVAFGSPGTFTRSLLQDTAEASLHNWNFRSGGW